MQLNEVNPTGAQQLGVAQAQGASEHMSHYSIITSAADVTTRHFFFFFPFSDHLAPLPMGDRENQAGFQEQQGATSPQVQQDAQHSQGQLDTSSSSQHRGPEITLDNLKMLMRSVAREVFKESRGQHQQPESSLSGGTTGKQKHRVFREWIIMVIG